MSSNCYFVADEVGLGKTRVACGVIHELKRLKGKNGQIHVINIASNKRISRQNIKEFQGFNVGSSNMKPANFQINTIKKVLRAFCDNYEESDCLAPIDAKNTLAEIYKDRDKDKILDRLTLCNQWLDQNRGISFALALSPKTSFYNGIDTYSGDSDERSVIYNLLQKLLDNIQQVSDEMIRCLLEAFCYE